MKTKASLALGAVFFAAYLTGCGGGGGNAAPKNPPQLVDISKPTVNSTTPAHNSVGVGTNSAITATFTEPMDPATLDAQSFILLKEGTTPVAGSVTYAGTTAQFRPADNLLDGVSYTATIKTGVKDLAGNTMAASYSWQFSTGVAPDNTAPTVLTTFPAANSTGVALNSAITVTFNEAIAPDTINDQTFIIMKDGTVPVAGSVTYFGTTAQFKPAGNLLAGASYTATAKTGVKDLAGNTLAQNVSWGFATGSITDSATPEMAAVYPPRDATNVPVDSAFVVTFQEPILPFEFGLIDGRPVQVTYNDTYTTFTMKPNDSMRPGVTYTTTVRVKDMAGNLMSTPFTWQFSTSP